MLPPCNFTGFMTAPQPQGWVQDGERWGLWRNGREIAAVQPDAKGVRVLLSCRKLWEDKEVQATNVRQAKRYAERWCAARVLDGVPLKEAVAQLVAKSEAAHKLSRTEIQQQRRLDAIPNPKL
jgi:hypothetical protein